MAAPTTLEIVGHNGQPVPNTCLRQQEGADQVGLVLPGLRYTCQMPLLYYASRVLLARHADVLWVEQAYHLLPGFQQLWGVPLPGSEHERRLFDDAAAAYRAVLRQSSYQRVAVIGKSLGTLSMSHLLTSEPALADARAVWLTPLLRDERVCVALRKAPQPSLIVIGSADGSYEPALLDEIRASDRRRVLVIDGADHSLEIRNDMTRSLHVLGQVMDAIESFLSEPPPATRD